MFRRILIANRGEVAARVARTCKRLGIETVAVCSEADRSLGWLEDVDRVICIGGARSAESYLHQEAILEAGLQTRCSAVHPGWGFLSENATFADRVEAAGMTFLGPPASLIDRLGDKVQARATMASLGVPVIPGSDGPLQSLEQARVLASEMGYPVLLKAASGGGGRGMRKVYRAEDLQAAWQEASAESQACFGDDRLYMERLIEGGRHIEFQVLVDAWGHGIHLGERECSIQRRHQKLLEESPSPALSPELRAEMGARVAGALAALGYRSAGTVEMLMSPEGELYFMEVNTRLQVEHPVTEMITGVDLVEWQLRIGAREPLTLRQEDVSFRGHALELRINAEDPWTFTPSPGKLQRMTLPEGEGVRVDTHLREGDRISPHYDSMVAKIICWGTDRAEALSRGREALTGLKLEGVTSNGELQSAVLDLPDFVEGRYDTHTLETWMEERG